MVNGTFKEHRCVTIGREQVTPPELYVREPDLAARFPANRHVREKMRQQLQAPRDRGWLRFEGRGRYRVAD